MKRITRLNQYGTAENSLKEHIPGHSSKLFRGEQRSKVILTNL